MRGQAALCAAQDKKAFFSGNPWECLIFFGTVEISTQVVCSCQGMDQKNDQTDVFLKKVEPQRGWLFPKYGWFMTVFHGVMTPLFPQEVALSEVKRSQRKQWRLMESQLPNGIRPAVFSNKTLGLP